MRSFACAHRGLSSERAENTLAAFQAAAEAGFAAVEMDLRTTADGQVVVLHDGGLERTTDGLGRVERLDWREVQRASTPDGPVPRLADLFDAMAGWKGLWNLEVKTRSATAPTLEIARRAGLAGRVLLSSMDGRVLQEAQELWPELPRAAVLVGPIDDGDLRRAVDAGCTWANVDWAFLGEQEMDSLAQAGLSVGAWTVNDVAAAEALCRAGVGCIITDQRDVGRAVGGAPPTDGWQSRR